MITYRDRGLRWGEVWFDEEPESSDVDVMVYRQRSAPIDPDRWLYFYTIVVDLSAPPEKLLSNMAKGTAYEIRRARDKDRITCRFWDLSDDKVLDQFVAFYDEFARSKGLLAINRAHISRFLAGNRLALSSASTQEGELLVYHMYVCSYGQTRVRLLHSASLSGDGDAAYKNLIGRANRFLHYYDMLSFKEQDVQIYDFGGWYAGKTDETRLRINHFKESFGGQVTHGYDCERPFSLKGRLFLILRAVRLRLFNRYAFQEYERRRKLIGNDKNPSTS